MSNNLGIFQSMKCLATSFFPTSISSIHKKERSNKHSYRVIQNLIAHIKINLIEKKYFASKTNRQYIQKFHNNKHKNRWR